MRSLEDRRERPQREILQGQTRTNQVQFKDKQTPEIKECTRKDQRESEWVKLPEHPHYAICPPSVCMRVGCVDIPTDDILKEWIQQGIVQQRHRFNSGHAVQRASLSLKWHCHFRRGFLQFRHAKPQGTVDESPIQCKEQSQQCNDVRTSTLF